MIDPLAIINKLQMIRRFEKKRISSPSTENCPARTGIKPHETGIKRPA
jgi:hypothetical protein